jgi:hypothetical protein
VSRRRRPLRLLSTSRLQLLQNPTGSSIVREPREEGNGERRAEANQKSMTKQTTWERMRGAFTSEHHPPLISSRSPIVMVEPNVSIVTISSSVGSSSWNTARSRHRIARISRLWIMCEKIEVGKRKNDDRRRSREGVGARSQVGCSLYGLRIVILICYI